MVATIEMDMSSFLFLVNIYIFELDWLFVFVTKSNFGRSMLIVHFIHLFGSFVEFGTGHMCVGTM